MTRAVLLYLFVCIVSLLRALVMPFALPFRSAGYRDNYYLAEDQAWNTVLNGEPDEAISARSHRRGWKRTERFINWLFRDDMHCAMAYVAEMIGTQNASEYRNG